MAGVAAIILAAGGSSRFGRAKQLATLDGVPLVRRAVGTAVAADCSPVIVVTGRDTAACTAALSGTPAKVVVNDIWERGIGSSLRCGVRALGDQNDSDETFILLGDQPAITANFLMEMLRVRQTTSTPVAIAAFADTIGPPVLVGRLYFERLRNWPDDVGAKALWQDDPARVTRVPCDAAAIDIDTPEDFARYAETVRK